VRDQDNFYRLHIFCCTNVRPDGHPRGCCKAKGGENFRNYLKARGKELELDDIRVNNAGCLDRCELGPALVIYPEGTWYTCQSVEDAEEILQNHIIGGEIVERLALAVDQEDLVAEQLPTAAD
jgi:(2Fe-2S) ferredoxin